MLLNKHVVLKNQDNLCVIAGHNLTKQVCFWYGMQEYRYTWNKKPVSENLEHTKNNTKSKWRVSFTGSLTCLETLGNSENTVSHICIPSESITVNYGQVRKHKYTKTFIGSKTKTTWLNSSVISVVSFLNNAQWITDKGFVIRLRNKMKKKKHCYYIT